MGRKAFYSGSRFEEMAGYSRALVADPWVFVSATSGPDRETKAYPADPVAQAKNALAIVEETLAAAGASFADVVQVRVYLSSRDHIVPISSMLGRLFKDPRPANTTIVCAFPSAEIHVEFEFVALKR